MKRAFGLLLALPLPVAHAAPAAKPLPMLPSIARVKVVDHAPSVTVTQDVLLPRGDWRGEPLVLHVALGAPAPRAIDVHLVPVEDGALEPADGEPGETLAVERVPRRPNDAVTLLGRETMAGVVVRLKPDAFTRALARGNMAALRVRSLVDAAPDGSVLVRLGATRGVPHAVGRIFSPGPMARLEARLCGPDADAHPLAARIGGVLSPAGEPTIAPILAVRHASDDLCLRVVRTSPP